MSATSAPGKLVVSGAYAVLRGAPAVVTAVDRRVTADRTKPPTFQAPEVLAAIDLLVERGILTDLSRPRCPWFDAGQLRKNDKKLGLGSSAAIAVACLWELSEDIPAIRDLDQPARRELTFELVRTAHRRAQGGGSGIDVAAATFGHTLLARIRSEGDVSLELAPLPSDLHFEVWSMENPATTADFVREVLALEQRAPDDFALLFGAQVGASHAAADALRIADSEQFVAALRAQRDALRALGDTAGVPIVLAPVVELGAHLPRSACFLPSGAGGGDVTLYVGTEPSPAEFRRRASEHGLEFVDLNVDAPGVFSRHRTLY